MNSIAYHRTEDVSFPLQLSPENVPETLDAAYGLMKEELVSWKGLPAAWKLGGTSHTTSRLYSVIVPYFGMLKDTEVWHSPCTPQLKDRQHTSVELECALRLGPSLSSILHEGEAALMNCPPELLFDQWAWGLEMPFSPLVNLSELGLPALVADRCAAGGLVLGEPHAFLSDSVELWKQPAVKLVIDGESRAEGRLEALTASPDICVRRFLVEALRYDFIPMPGQWVASGGITPCFSVGAVKQVDVLWGDKREATIFLPDIADE